MNNKQKRILQLFIIITLLILLYIIIKYFGRIDSIGNVYLIITDQNSKNEDEEIIHMLKGEGTDVKSKLRLSYKTFLSFTSRDKKNIQL